MRVQQLTDQLAISDALTEDDVRRLRTMGFRSVIDLRSDGEPRSQSVPPWRESTLVREAGLSYHQIAVEPPMLSDALAFAIRRAFHEAPAPVLLHCTSGRRAGTFALILLSCDNDMSVDDCLIHGRQLGLDFDGMPRLTRFLRRFVERHGMHYQAATRSSTG